MVQTFAPPDSETLLLNLPAEIKLEVTPDQFAILAAHNRDLRLERTAQGELIVNPPTGWQSGKRNTDILGELYIWWRQVGEPGTVFESSTGFTLPNGAIRSPDASWVSPERWAALTPAQKGTFAEICPDFVVELRSQYDTLPPLQAKMAEYLENGAELGWLIDPQNRSVEIYRVGLPVEVLANPTELTGDRLLPGFRLDLQRIWGESREQEVGSRE
ncbi:MAG: Uma2 family endonuclease [Spirulina sp. DLM2.Bin59]|nr:MAG: Uma2 family endonuclease [Spirulina sp. DLM2.Bin59]